MYQQLIRILLILAILLIGYSEAEQNNFEGPEDAEGSGEVDEPADQQLTVGVVGPKNTFYKNT